MQNNNFKNVISKQCKHNFHCLFSTRNQGKNKDKQMFLTASCHKMQKLKENVQPIPEHIIRQEKQTQLRVKEFNHQKFVNLRYVSRKPTS